MEDKKITADYVERLYKSAENWTDIRQQLRNLNFYLGNQWITWNNTLKRIEKLQDEPGKIRLSFNKIQPKVNTLVSKHTKNKIKYNVIPASREQNDIDAAKAADKYLDHMWDVLSLSEKSKQIFLYMIIQKRCMTKTYYDAEAGNDISPTPEDGDIFDDWVEAGANPIKDGEIKVKVCDPLTIFIDPTAKSKEEIRWVIERYAKDVDDIKEEYEVDEISAEANLDYLGNYELGTMGSTQRKSEVNNMAIVMELWMKPCRKHPNGLKVTVCNGKIIDYNENSGELPYDLFGYIPIPSSLMYEAVVSNLIEPQKNFNINRSMLATHALRMGNSVWKVPHGAKVDEDELTNETGAIIYYAKDGGEPKREPGIEIPSVFWNDVTQTAQDIEEASLTRDISHSTLPAGLDTLGGLELMVEQDHDKLTVGGQEYELGMTSVLKKVLKLIQKHYTEERQYKIIGENGEVEIKAFNGSDLTGNEDIKVIQGSSLPEIKAVQQERITMMYQMGAIVKRDGTPDHEKFLRMMGQGNSEELFGQQELDSNNAKLENEDYSSIAEDEEKLQALNEYMGNLAKYQNLAVQPGEGVTMPFELPKVWSVDDHEVHLREHNHVRKTSYRKWPQPLRDLFDQHCAEHEQALQAPIEQQQQMMMQQQQAQQETQMQMKQMDTQAALQKEQLKAETQITVASMRR